MSNDHWFIDVMSELVDEAKRDMSPNVWTGLGTVLEVFCAEAGLSEEQTKAAREFVSLDTRHVQNANSAKESSNGSRPQPLDA